MNLSEPKGHRLMNLRIYVHISQRAKAPAHTLPPGSSDGGPPGVSYSGSLFVRPCDVNQTGCDENT